MFTVCFIIELVMHLDRGDRMPDGAERWFGADSWKSQSWITTQFWTSFLQCLRSAAMPSLDIQPGSNMPDLPYTCRFPLLSFAKVTSVVERLMFDSLSLVYGACPVTCRTLPTINTNIINSSSSFVANCLFASGYYPSNPARCSEVEFLRMLRSWGLLLAVGNSSFQQRRTEGWKDDIETSDSGRERRSDEDNWANRIR